MWENEVLVGDHMRETVNSVVVGGRKLTLRDTASRLLVDVLLPPELLASSSDKDSKDSVDCPLNILFGDCSSGWICRGGGSLLFCEGSRFPAEICTIC